jgi:hypothetical protein
LGTSTGLSLISEREGLVAAPAASIGFPSWVMV